MATSRWVSGDGSRPFHAGPAVAVGVGAAHRAVDPAVRWAAGEAARRQSPLHLVHVFTPLPFGTTAGVLSCAYLSPGQLAAERETAVRELCDLADQARAEHVGLHTIVDVFDGEPASTLVALANSGEQLVLGPGRQRPALTALLGGTLSVPFDRLRSPVVFVKRQKAFEGPIAAVIHGLPGSRPVIVRACEFAAERCCDIEIVCLPPGAANPCARQIAAYEEELFDTLAAIRPQHPSVGITARAVPNAQAMHALSLSPRALLVIGARRGSTLTSVIQRRRVRRLIRAGSAAVCVVPTGG